MFDLASSEYATARNPYAREAFPLFRASDGRFSATRYLGVVMPLNAFATYANLRHGDKKAVRVLTLISGFLKIGVAIDNLHQAH
jgi:hypothetical protein